MFVYLDCFRFQFLYLLRRKYFVFAVFLPFLYILVALGLGLLRIAGSEIGSLAHFGPLAILVAWLFQGYFAYLLGLFAVGSEIEDRSIMFTFSRPVGFHAWLTARYFGSMILLVLSTVLTGISLGVLLVALNFPLSHLGFALSVGLCTISFASLYAYVFFCAGLVSRGVAVILATCINGAVFRTLSVFMLGVGAMWENVPAPFQAIGEILSFVVRLLPDTFAVTSTLGFLNIYEEPTFASTIALFPSVLYSLILLSIFYALSAVVYRRKPLA